MNSSLKKSALSSFFILSMVLVSQAQAKTKSECANEEKYPLIDKKELTSVVEGKKAFVIDVNSKESFAKNHVPTAVHFGTLGKKFGQTLPKDKDALIVAYCGGPQCTAWLKAAEKACEMGYTNIRHFKGGIQEWTEKSS